MSVGLGLMFRMKQKMLRKRSKTLNDVTTLRPELNEQLLFHGTRQQFVEPIYSQGFDWRLAGKCISSRREFAERISLASLSVIVFSIGCFTQSAVAF